MLQGTDISRARAWALALIAGLVAAWGFSALVAERASAQGPGSDFCEEYPDAPGCVAPTGPTGPTGTTDDTGPTDDAGPSANAPGGGGDGDGDGNLPFTGYPLTALILLLLVLLLAGLALRAYLAVRDRLAHGDRTAGP
jgi:hypothetical protein